MVYILIAPIVKVIPRLLVERRREAAHLAHLNDHAGATTAISFVAFNALLIAVALRSG